MATSKSKFVLKEAELQDATEISEIFYSAFHTHDFFRACFPKTPASVDAWSKCIEYGINDTEYTRTLKVVDTESGEIVGAGRWVLPRKDGDSEQPAEEEERWAPIMDYVDPELSPPFFESFDVHRHSLMGNRRHYYMELLFTAKKYHRSGAGSMILDHGVKLADADQLECYIGASEMGRPLYEKFGFVFTEEQKMPRFDLLYSYGIRKPN